jgi:phosphoenolpyruvate carboxylase
MSTQHPDNVTLPFFAVNSVLSGEDEVQEAYYAFSHLGIEEQLWDSEGKESDSHVVKHLLTKHEQFFRTRKLGKDVFLTLRVPNPAIEKNEAKILLETMESIPRAFDVAQRFYGEDIAPISEVVLPMTRSAAELERIYTYYTDFVVGKQQKSVGDIKIKDWIGAFQPEKLNVVPLVEDKESLIGVKKIVGDYLAKHKKLEYQRVWLARSDPALNYGMLSAVLLNKYALAQLDELQEKTSIDIYPVIGVGSVPFRGNFSPENINCLRGYPSVQTFTVQSAFKYDHPYQKVREAVQRIQDTKRGKAFAVDKAKCFDIIDRYSKKYIAELQAVVHWVHKIAPYVPKRRKRKLHIGLFGYSRGVGELHLPRAITFCASLYSLGLPPELLGLSSVTAKDMEFLEQGVYKNFIGDMRSALQYVNIDAMKVVAPKLVGTTQQMLKKFDVQIHNEHTAVTSTILEMIKSEHTTELQDKIQQAAWMRRALG